jgi:glycosyltransferase involved in cell wall biosynthesis
MTLTPLVSIIVNNYNYGHFLADAIDSALRQTYAAVEVIVVDDGSTDTSREIICGYGERVHAIFKDNGGQASAMNAGFARAAGELIIFLDADDMMLPDTTLQVVTAWACAAQMSRIHYRMEVIDAHGHPTGTIKPHWHLPMPRGDLRRHVLTFPDDMAWLPTSGNAYSAQVLHQIFPIPEQAFRILADVYLSHVTPLFGLVVALDQVGAYYRVHGHNNYECTELNLDQVRRTITHWRAAHEALRHFAAMLNLSTEHLGSVSYAANRMISLRLAPAQHPIASDSVTRLVRCGIRAALRRRDVRLPMRLMFISWFLAMALVPRRVAQALAIGFLFPDRRVRVNRMLRLLHRQQVHPKHRLQVSK